MGDVSGAVYTPFLRKLILFTLVASCIEFNAYKILVRIPEWMLGKWCGKLWIGCSGRSL